MYQFCARPFEEEEVEKIRGFINFSYVIVVGYLTVLLCIETVVGYVKGLIVASFPGHTTPLQKICGLVPTVGECAQFSRNLGKIVNYHVISTTR